MSPTTASAGPPSSDAAAAAEVAGEKFGAARSAVKAITARFAAANAAAWAPGAACTMVFLCSPAVRDGTHPTAALLGWVNDGDWARHASVPRPSLAVTAGRYASLSGVAGAFDLREDEPVREVPGDWVETRVFNLAAVHAAVLHPGDTRG